MPDTTRNEHIEKIVRPALAYCAAGLTNAVAFGVGSGGSGLFDPHSTPDALHPKMLNYCFDTIDYFLRGATYLGFADRVLLMVVSDFGRTPSYPDGDGTGKGHWPIGTAQVMGNQIPSRVVGSMGPRLEAISLSGKSLKNDDQGVFLLPDHLHVSMRRLLGIHDHKICRSFPLSPAPVDLFA